MSEGKQWEQRQQVWVLGCRLSVLWAFQGKGGYRRLGLRRCCLKSWVVSRWMGKVGRVGEGVGSGEGRAGTMTTLTRARDSCSSPSPPHRGPDLVKALWMEAWTRHICAQGPSEALIHTVKRRRTERRPRISCMLGQTQAKSQGWKKSHAFVHSLIHSDF